MCRGTEIVFVQSCQSVCEVVSSEWYVQALLEIMDTVGDGGMS